MTDEQTEAEPAAEIPAPERQQVAVRPERALVRDVVAIFDSERFSHYGRIAAVMAASSIVPDTLKAGGRDTAIANCFQVCELADRWNMSPFAVAQCASVVYGKLMLEGKLVQARLQSVGIEVNCYFAGKPGTADYRVYVTDAELTEEQIAALSPGAVPFGVKMIDGSVGEWQTFEKDKRTVSGAWAKQPQMQLRYRGARVWARAYAPAEMLGIYTEDDFDDLRERSVHVGAQVERPALTAGFGDETDQQFRRSSPEPETDEPVDAEIEEIAQGEDETSAVEAETVAEPKEKPKAEPKKAATPPKDKPATPAADLGEVFATAHTRIDEAKDWLGVKQAIVTMTKAVDGQSASQDDVDAAMKHAWERYGELGEAETKATPVATDVLLFRLWMRFAEPPAEDIDKEFAKLVRTPAWSKQSEAARTAFGAAMNVAKSKATETEAT